MSATPTPRSARHGVTRRQVITTGALTIAALAALAAPASPVVRLSGVMKADAMAQMPNELVVQGLARSELASRRALDCPF